MHKTTRHQDGKPIVVECLACYDEEGSSACIRPSHDNVAKGRLNPLYTPVCRVGADKSDLDDEEILVKTVRRYFRANPELKELAPHVRGGVRLFNFLLEATKAADEVPVPRGFTLSSAEVSTSTETGRQQIRVVEWITKVLSITLDLEKNENRCCQNGIFGRKHVCCKQPA